MLSPGTIQPGALLPLFHHQGASGSSNVNMEKPVQKRYIVVSEVILKSALSTEPHHAEMNSRVGHRVSTEVSMHNSIRHTRDELATHLAHPGDPLIPELHHAVRHPQEARDRPATRLLFDGASEILADIRNIPQLTYTLYREVQRNTDRIPYQNVRQEKRSKLVMAALQVVLGDDDYLNLLHDYLWSTCEETNWLLPQVERMGIELRVPATALDLAEIIDALGDRIEERAADRVRDEVERRVFTPYLADPEKFHWYRGHNNWNGVCNGAIGAAFLLLEQDRERLACALEIVLEGLDAFLRTAFAPDGASGEGVGYWQYGLSNFICFAEMLRRRTRGAIDILSIHRLKEIATFPLRVMLSPGRFFAYSDCNEVTALDPGFVARLSERTGVLGLKAALAEPAPLSMGLGHFHTAWRNMLWWDGDRPPQPALGDDWLKQSEVTRLTASTPSGAPVVLAAKAGHNGVPHNHNDIGGFVLHVDGETFLCDPERGLYDLYLRSGHDRNIFANSFGHSVPRIGDSLQSRGTEFRGKITRCDTSTAEKRVEMRIEGAYEVADLEAVHRSLCLTEQGDLIVEDSVTFSGSPRAVEEAFVTWNKTMVSGRTALIVGDRHILQMTIESPEDATWDLAVLEEESTENHKSIPLKRLSFVVAPSEKTVTTRARATILPQ